MESIQTVAIQIGVLFAVLLVIMGLLEYQERRHRPARPVDQVLAGVRRLRVEIAATILAGYVEHRPPTPEEDGHYAARSVQLAVALMTADMLADFALVEAKDELDKWREAAKTRNREAMAERLGLRP
jgi:hypothetical protein